tara:strand:- start:113 stop:442 length:330 start_codon:yes stop_codon:yes gene_type:complete
MAVTWTIATLEHEISDGAVIVAHWRASDSEVVGEGDEAVTYSGSSYGTCGFSPDPTSPSYVPYSDITEEMAIGWTQDSLGEEQVESIEASIAAQIDVEKNPTQEAGVPW